MAVVEDATSGNQKIPLRNYDSAGPLPIIDQGKPLIGGYTNDARSAYSGTLPCVIFGDHTRTLKYVDFPFALGADGVKVLVPRSKQLEAKFLYHYLRSHKLPDAGYSRHFKFLKDTQIPLPPLPEQRRIVRLLDRAAKIRCRADAARAKARAIIPALFLDMFGDPATNPRGWRVEPLGNHVSLIGGGTPSKTKPEFWGGIIPWVSPKDMKDPIISDSEDKITDGAMASAPVRLIPPGNVLIVVRGMILAHTVPIRMNSIAVAVNQDMKAMLPGDQLKAAFLRWMLQGAHGYLLKKVRESAHGTRKLETPVLRALPAMLPPLALQTAFVTQARRIEAAAGALDTAAAKAEAMGAALSAEIFD